MPPTGFLHKKARRLDHFFTLIEILAAMAVLSILMLMLFQFFGSAQKAWSHTEANAEVFESARVIFEVIQRDLQGAVARKDDIPGKNITFCWSDSSTSWPSTGFPTNNPGGVKLQFVSANANDGSLSEIRYQLSNTPTIPNYRIGYDGSTLKTAFPNRLLRASIDVSHGADPYSDPPANFTAASGNTELRKIPQCVADGVLDMKIECYPTTSWTISTKQNFLPEMVTVQIKLLDKKSYGLWTRLNDAGATVALQNLENRQARIFSRTFFLNSRQ